MNCSEAKRLTLEKNETFQYIVEEIKKTAGQSEYFFLEMKLPNLRDNWDLCEAILAHFREDLGYDVEYNQYTEELTVRWSRVMLMRST